MNMGEMHELLSLRQRVKEIPQEDTLARSLAESRLAELEAKWQIERDSRVQLNKEGWHAIKHKDGWWLGNEEGVLCYRDKDDAKTALTIIWQRDGGKQVNFRIETYSGTVRNDGEYTPKLSAEEALDRYESQIKRKLNDLGKGDQSKDQPASDN